MINKKDLLVLWLFILIAIQNPCISQSISLQSDSSLHGKYINSISASNLSKHILTLASNSFGGRKMGQSGIDSAANYLEYEYNRLGLQQVVNDYKQEFTIFDWQYSIQTLTSDQFQIEVFPTWNGALMDSAELVFVGDGYEKDYAGISVEDKMVAYYHRETSMLDPSESQPVIALRHDAKYRLCIHADSESFKSQMEKSQAFDPRAKLTDVSDKTRKAILFNVTEEDFRKLYNVEENIFLDQYHEEGKLSKGQRKQIIKQVYLNLDYHTKPITTSNIVGVIEGSDLKEEAIVISAHYDHLGTTLEDIFHGSDDNASGTSALLEIARVFMMAKADGNGPRRTVVFVAFSAEEEGLLGSEYYVQNAVFPLKKTVANLNFDMVGRVSEEKQDNPNYVYVIGSSHRSEKIYQINEQVAERFLPILNLDYTFDDPNSAEQLYKRSDQYHFMKNNIPALFFTDMMKADFHKSSDTADKIDLQQLKIRTQLGFGTAWELANRDD